MKTETVNRAMEKIRETADKPKILPTIKLSWTRSNGDWIDRHLGLDMHCEKLQKLAAEIGLFCLSAFKNPKDGWLLVLAGRNGSAKTHCARAVNAWINKVGPSCEFIANPGVVEKLSCAMWHYGELLDTLKGGGWDLVDELKEVPVLIVDDLGAAHDPSMIGIDKMTQILGRREFKWTIVTTNVAPKDWPSVFDNRVASRLARNSTVVDLFNVPDYAEVKAKKGKV